MSYENIKRKDQWVFSSIHEVCEILKDTIDRESIIGSESSKEARGSDWCDSDSLEQAIEMLQYGYEYDEFDDMVDGLNTSGHETKRQISNGVVGHTVIVPLYLQGIPTSMVTTKSVINNKIINIFYDASAPHYVKSDDILEATRKMMTRIINLENEGYRVNLYVIETNNNDYDFCWGIKLKSDRERFNTKKMAFPLVSTSMLRRIGFRIKEALYEHNIGGGYGSASFNKAMVKRCIRGMFGAIRDYEVYNHEGLQYESKKDRDRG